LVDLPKEPREIFLKSALQIIKALSGVLQYPQDIMFDFQTGINFILEIIRAKQRSVYSQMAIAM
jgi:hypothetical protein